MDVSLCGGNRLATADILSLDGAVEEKASMSEAREGHGVLALHSTVYVFGGLGINTCEKFQLLQNTWVGLPPMQEYRWWSNPCLLLGVVHLCGQGTTAMEAFAPHTDTFLPLLITSLRSRYRPHHSCRRPKGHSRDLPYPGYPLRHRQSTSACHLRVIQEQALQVVLIYPLSPTCP